MVHYTSKRTVRLSTIFGAVDFGKNWCIMPNVTSDILAPIFVLVLASISSVNVYFSSYLVSVLKFVLVFI